MSETIEKLFEEIQALITAVDTAGRLQGDVKIYGIRHLVERLRTLLSHARADLAAEPEQVAWMACHRCGAIFQPRSPLEPHLCPEEK